MARTTYKLSETRTFGIEIEAYGVERSVLCDALRTAGIACQDHGYSHATTDHWKIVSDSSIQGENTFELVSPPLKGADGIRQVETVCAVLHTLGVKVNKSCGLHVHHDANDLSLDHWKNLVKYYIKYEATLDTLVPSDRRQGGNSYCKALRANFASIKDAFKAIDRATTLRELSEIVCGNNRYYTLNMTAFWRHGTVEVRHHSGTVEADKILHWVSLTQCLVTRAMESATVRLHGTDLKAVCAKGWAVKPGFTSKPSTTTATYYAARQTALATS